MNTCAGSPGLRPAASASRTWTRASSRARSGISATFCRGQSVSPTYVGSPLHFRSRTRRPSCGASIWSCLSPFSASVTLHRALPVSIRSRARSLVASRPLASSFDDAVAAFFSERVRSSADSMISWRLKIVSSRRTKVRARSSSSSARARSRSWPRRVLSAPALVLSILLEAARRSARPSAASFSTSKGSKRTTTSPSRGGAPSLAPKATRCERPEAGGTTIGVACTDFRVPSALTSRTNEPRATSMVATGAAPKDPGRRRAGLSRSGTSSARVHAEGRSARATAPAGRVHGQDAVAGGQTPEDLDLLPTAAPEAHRHFGPAEAAAREDDGPRVTQEDRLAGDQEPVRKAARLDLSPEPHGRPHQRGVAPFQGNLDLVHLGGHPPGLAAHRAADRLHPPVNVELGPGLEAERDPLPDRHSAAVRLVHHPVAPHLREVGEREHPLPGSHRVPHLLLLVAPVRFIEDDRVEGRPHGHPGDGGLELGQALPGPVAAEGERLQLGPGAGQGRGLLCPHVLEIALAAHAVEDDLLELVTGLQLPRHLQLQLGLPEVGLRLRDPLPDVQGLESQVDLVPLDLLLGLRQLGPRLHELTVEGLGVESQDGFALLDHLSLGSQEGD